MEGIVTCAIRAEAAKASTKRTGWLGREVAAADEATAKERAALADVILKSYVKDGVWTLTIERFCNLLRQNYGGGRMRVGGLGGERRMRRMSFMSGYRKGFMPLRCK